MAWLVAWLGGGEGDVARLKLVWCLLGAATAYLVYRAVRRDFGEAPALAAGILCAASTGLLILSTSLNNETPWLLLAVLAVAWGAVNAAACLVRAEHLIFFVLGVGWIVLGSEGGRLASGERPSSAGRRRPAAARPWRAVALALAMFVAVLAPWHLRAWSRVARFNDTPMTLPPVVFIDPNFVDMPPIGTANDDHPPASLNRGQQFLKCVFNAVVGQPEERWRRTLLLITYDEHGGFFDHVPPPGTAAGPPEFLGQVPRIHPEGADYLGPRVPTLLVSPWVGAGEVCKTVFDHTSIFKTILVRHRNRLRWGTFKLTKRVKQANHLGAALDQTMPRGDMPVPFDAVYGRRRVSAKGLATASAGRATPTRSEDGDRRDPHVGLARLALPRLGPR